VSEFLFLGYNDAASYEIRYFPMSVTFDTTQSFTSRTKRRAIKSPRRLRGARAAMPSIEPMVSADEHLGTQYCRLALDASTVAAPVQWGSFPVTKGNAQAFGRRMPESDPG